MQRKFCKGLHHVIATVLIILVVIVASIITYSYVVGFVGARISSGKPRAIESRLKCEGVEALPSGGLKLYVRNSGRVEEVIDTVYFIQ